MAQKLLCAFTTVFSDKRFEGLLCVNHQGERRKNKSHNAKDKQLLYYALQEYQLLPFFQTYLRKIEDILMKMLLKFVNILQLLYKVKQSLHKVNRLLKFAVKQRNSILVSSLFIMVATCYGHS